MRRRPLSASIVTTVSLFAGCGAPEPGATEPSAGPGTASAEPTASATASETASAAPVVTAQPSAVVTASGSSAPSIKQFTMGEISRINGKCTWVEDVQVPACPANAVCNPPPVFALEVSCPHDVPLPVRVSISQNDGKCSYYEPRTSPPCPPNAHCNPPPPQRLTVKCPPSIAPTP